MSGKYGGQLWFRLEVIKAWITFLQSWNDKQVLFLLMLADGKKGERLRSREMLLTPQLRLCQWFLVMNWQCSCISTGALRGFHNTSPVFLAVRSNSKQKEKKNIRIIVIILPGVRDSFWLQWRVQPPTYTHNKAWCIFIKVLSNLFKISACFECCSDTQFEIAQ